MRGLNVATADTNAAAPRIVTHARCEGGAFSHSRCQSAISGSKVRRTVASDAGAAAKIANRDYRLVEMYTFVAVVYFIISFSLSVIVKRLQTRMAIVR